MIKRPGRTHTLYIALVAPCGHRGNRVLFPQKLDLSWNPYSLGSLQFYDQQLVDKLRARGCAEAQDFFTALALCHTVMSEWKEGR